MIVIFLIQPGIIKMSDIEHCKITNCLTINVMDELLLEGVLMTIKDKHITTMKVKVEFIDEPVSIWEFLPNFSERIQGLIKAKSISVDIQDETIRAICPDLV